MNFREFAQRLGLGKRVQEQISPVDQANHRPQFDDFYGLSSPQFRNNVIDAYNAISPEFRGFAESQGQKLHIGLIAGHVLADSSPVAARRGKGEIGENDRRTNVNQMGAFYNPASNRVVVPEFVLKMDPAIDSELAVYDVYSDSRVDPTKWQPQPRSLPKLVRHEFFHGIDFNCAYKSFWGNEVRLSDSPRFKAAYDADVVALGGPEEAKKKGFGYFIRDELNDGGAWGRGEVLTETMSHHEGGGLNKSVPAAFTRSTQVAGEFHAGFKQAYNLGGPEAAKKFARDFGENRISPPLEMAAEKVAAGKGRGARLLDYLKQESNAGAIVRLNTQKGETFGMVGDPSRLAQLEATLKSQGIATSREVYEKGGTTNAVLRVRSDSMTNFRELLKNSGISPSNMPVSNMNFRESDWRQVLPGKVQSSYQIAAAPPKKHLKRIAVRPTTPRL